MIDVSDGLTNDLMHICEQSHVGAFIEEGKCRFILIQNEQRWSLNSTQSHAHCMEAKTMNCYLQLTKKIWIKVRYMPEVFIIGEITVPTEGLTLHTTGGNIHPLMAQGWNHFDSNQHQ